MILLGRLNKSLVMYLLGVMMVLLGGMCILPAVTSYVYNESSLRIFLMSAVSFAVIGTTLMFIFRNYDINISKTDGQFAVGLLWFIIPLLGALPYMFFAGEFSLSEALFESYSGYTTTGSSVIDNFDSLPRSILLYRSMTQWIGGLGFTVLVILFLKRFKGSMNNLFSAEFFSSSYDKMFPHIRTTISRIFIVYTGLTVLCFVFLKLEDLDFFQALCYSFSTVSTGGFTVSEYGLAEYPSIVQITVACFMTLSGISFFMIVNLLRGKFRIVAKDEQLRVYLLLIVLTSVCFVLYWTDKNYMTFGERVKNAFFYSCSIISTTGYELNTAHPGMFVSAALLILMFIGGCSSSSSTGLKVIRIILLVRYAKVSLIRIFHPKAVIPVRYNSNSIKDTEIRRVFGFFFLYLCIFAMGTFLLCLFDNNFTNSIVMSAANLGNIGPFVSGYTTDFTYSALNLPSKITLVALMMIGRLEIFSFFALFSKSLWKGI